MNSSRQRDSVSFVFPVYNEQGVIEKMLRAYYQEFKGKLDFEMIVAEDGSTDRTKEILRKLETELDLRLFMHDDRKGYLKAIREALTHPTSTWIFLVDSDHQFDPSDFWKLWPYRTTDDLILGIKRERKDGFLRSFLSKGYNLLLKFFFRVPYEDMDTGFRLFRKTVVDEVAPTVRQLGFFTAEFLIRSHDRGYRIRQIPVQHFKQQVRPSNIFHPSRLPGIIAKELRSIWRLFKEIRFSHTPKSHDIKPI